MPGRPLSPRARPERCARTPDAFPRVPASQGRRGKREGTRGEGGTNLEELDCRRGEGRSDRQTEGARARATRRRRPRKIYGAARVPRTG